MSHMVHTECNIIPSYRQDAGGPGADLPRAQGRRQDHRAQRRRESFRASIIVNL